MEPAFTGPAMAAVNDEICFAVLFPDSRVKAVENFAKLLRKSCPAFLL